MADGGDADFLQVFRREAGEKLVTEHYPRIYRLLRHLTASIDNAEDLTQQTFVKAWQALATFRGEASLATWLHCIAYHEYTHWLRARREQSPLDDAVGVADESGTATIDNVPSGLDSGVAEVLYAGKKPSTITYLGVEGVFTDPAGG